jgi:predicted phosphodiesterase
VTGGACRSRSPTRNEAALRVAALYDVHGNLHALQAVLADVREAGVDAIVLGGDDLAGPWPAETAAALAAIELPVHRVRGNADRELVGAPGRAPPEVIEWVRGRLDEATLAEIATRALTASLEVDGLGAVLFCHATPRNDTEIRTSLSPDERWREVLAGVDERTIVCGHTHVQFERLVDGVHIVNAGSVGMAFEDEPGAYWALLGPGVELRRTAYDVIATRAAIEVVGYPTEWGEATAAEASEYFESIAYD